MPPQRASRAVGIAVAQRVQHWPVALGDLVPVHAGAKRGDDRPARDPGLDEAVARRVVAREDPLQDQRLDLLTEDDARDCAQRKTSTVPVVPLTRTRSPVEIRSVASDVPTTAGIPNSRATTAGCDATPPASVTSPPIFVKRTTHAGFVIWQTRISPSCTWSNSSVDETIRAVPSTTPGEAARPVTSSTFAGGSRWNFSGKPQSDQYGKASASSVAVPIHSGGRTSACRSRSSRRDETSDFASNARGSAARRRSSL